MGLKMETRIIAGCDVRSQQLPALASFNLMTKLGRIITPVLDKIDLSNISMESDIGALTPALAALFSNMDSDESGPLLCEILATTSVTLDDDEGHRIEHLTNREAINRVFSGRMRMMFEVIVFALKVNFADFFDGALDDQKSSAEPEESESQSSSTSPKKSKQRGRRGVSG